MDMDGLLPGWAAAKMDKLEADNAKLRELKTPASRQLLNITKSALDHCEQECAKLRAALEKINGWASEPMMIRDPIPTAVMRDIREEARRALEDK